MLSLKSKQTNLPRIVLNISSNKGSTQRSDLNNGYLNEIIADVINKVSDNEVVDFKPGSESIGFNIFFSEFKNVAWFNQIGPHIEDAFKIHFNNSLKELKKSAKKTITNPKVPLQETGIPAPKHDFFFHKRMVEVLGMTPYVPLDPIEQLTGNQPTKEGIPVFYDSFAIPFGTSLDKWGDNSLGFSNKTFLYNSFLLLDFYTSNNPLSQKRVMSVPIYINGRYMDNEVNTKGVSQIRPNFRINDSTEGYSLQWLGHHAINKLYVRFSFWDALNGVQVSLVPSGAQSGDKKWVQNPNSFKHENLYLEYFFNYDTRQYKISEYNKTTGVYDIESNNFDLYQLVYDEYFSGLERVENVNTREVTGPVRDARVLVSNDKMTKEINTNIESSKSNYKIFAAKFKPRSENNVIKKALHQVFEGRKIQLKDKSLTSFELLFNDDNNRTAEVGLASIKNVSGGDLIIKKISVRNVVVENKNGFIDGAPIIHNTFEKPRISTSNGDLINKAKVGFNSNFFQKSTALQTHYNNLQAGLFNDTNGLYDSHYFDETNNKVMTKGPHNLNDALGKLSSRDIQDFFTQLLTKGSSVLKFIKDKKAVEAKIKGVTFTDKDLNILLREDVLSRGGVKLKYESHFPVTVEKLANKGDDYNDFTITIINKVTPGEDTITSDSIVGVKSEILFGKDFFRLYAAANDELVIRYDLVITFIDGKSNVTSKIIPCDVKFL